MREHGMRKGGGILYILMLRDQSSHVSGFYFVSFHENGKRARQRQPSAGFTATRLCLAQPVTPSSTCLPLLSLSVIDTGVIRDQASASPAPWRPPFPTVSQQGTTAQTWGTAKLRPTVWRRQVHKLNPNPQTVAQ